MNILCYPNEVLRQKAQAIAEFDDQLRQFADEMIETMHQANGVGLAAPQVGRSIRLIILNVSEEADDNLVMVNPEIVERDGSMVSEEGCLSFPGIFINVQRAAHVVVRYQDLQGNQHQIEGDGLLARALQHEIDHLEGVLLADKMNPVQRLANRRGLKMLELRQQYRQQMNERKAEG